MSRLRSYAPMKAERDPLPGQIHDAMLARSEGFCEVTLDGVRCRARVWDFHHTVKPRAEHNAPAEVIAICRPHHDRCEWPFRRGRLTIAPNGDGTFTCAIVTAPDKFTYRDREVKP